MRKIKIAQIGIGHDHAGAIFNSLRRRTDIFEVVGYARVPEDDLDLEWTIKCRKNPTIEYKGAKEYTVEEIFAMPDLDAVAIETYDLNLVKYAQMAAEKGLHIHMDKAPGESAEDFEKLLSTIKEKNLAFSIGYMYRFNPQVREAFEKVRKGELGNISCVDTDMSCFYPLDKREWLANFKGGMMQYLGCHLIDLVVRLLGVPERIIPHNASTNYQGTNALDLGFAVLEYKNCIATVKTSMNAIGGYVRRQMVIEGDKGAICVRPLEIAAGVVSHITARSTQYDSLNWEDLGKTTETEVFERYEEMLSFFAKMVRGEKQREVSLEQEALVHRCLLAAGGYGCDYKKEIKL